MNFATVAPYNAQNLYNPRQYPVPTAATTVVTPTTLFRSTFDDRVTYFQDRVKLTSKWDLWAGVGYVENDAANGPAVGAQAIVPNTHVVVPTGAIVFKPTSSSNYYVSYAEGVSRAEVVSTLNPQIVNPGEYIGAVRSKAYEVGAKWVIANRLFFNVAAFQMEQPFVIQEAVSPATPLLLRRYAGGLNRFKGVSMDIRGKLQRNLDIQGGITYLDPKQVESATPALEGLRSAGVSRVSGAINLTWDVGAAQGLTVDGGVYYQGGMPLNVQNTYNLDGFTRLDLGASYDTEWNNNEVRLRVLVENLADKNFYYGFSNGFQLAAPRTLNASVLVRFE